MDAIASLFHVVENYRAATGLSESRVSTLLFSGGARLSQIRAGKDVGARILHRALQNLSANWPEGAVWPEGVARPDPNHPEVAALRRGAAAAEAAE